ncbi:MAG TPA: bifunctional precorrin-2 dehydrogenase/sirohydrochlorin ferrochelatase, partial [Thermoanaerobaculia bacterium]|nr:bifunctional precorrin-2 dehydrogenase/sirohydrochlorin ferrochelatase [Thermoanaerobaculia bacterium]
ARVTVVSPVVAEEVRRMADAGQIVLLEKSYEPDDLAGSTLVIASTDDACVNARVARDSRRMRIPVNVVDLTHLCDFIVPSVVEQGSVQIAVSTSGKSPALARELRAAIEASIGAEWSEVNDLLGRLRPIAKKALATDRDRKELFDSILASGVVKLIRDGRRDQAIERIAALCRERGVPTAELLPPIRD